mmetsp:Transcript_174003/g.557839  ORF Transcript_174003/g.557839 Transcript_174003/m.557839 type:complete len:213 (-) Transcript_174003:1027-1665(-)
MHRSRGTPRWDDWVVLNASVNPSRWCTAEFGGPRCRQPPPGAIRAAEIRHEGLPTSAGCGADEAHGVLFFLLLLLLVGQLDGGRRAREAAGIRLNTRGGLYADGDAAGLRRRRLACRLRPQRAVLVVLLLQGNELSLDLAGLRSGASQREGAAALRRVEHGTEARCASHVVARLQPQPRDVQRTVRSGSLPAVAAQHPGQEASGAGRDHSTA